MHCQILIFKQVPETPKSTHLLQEFYSKNFGVIQKLFSLDREALGNNCWSLKYEIAGKEFVSH